MATFTQAQGARTLIFDISMVGSGYYGVSPAVDLGPNIPPDVTLEVEADPNGTPTGNKRLMLFAKLSLDNVNFGSGPESGTDTTNESDLHWIGTLPCNDTNVHRKMFSLQSLPVARYLKIVVKNEAGVLLTSGKVYSAGITGLSV
jgi:hypothetical protein